MMATITKELLLNIKVNLYYFLLLILIVMSGNNIKKS